MMQTAAVQKISEQNSPYKAMLDRAYMIGYTDAMNQERSRRRAARERREILFCNTDTDTIFLWSGIRLYCIAFKINCNPIR